MSTITRHDLLRIGTLGAMALQPLLQAKALAATAWTPIRSVILLQQYAAPSHIDLWNPKPDAPRRDPR